MAKSKVKNFFQEYATVYDYLLSILKRTKWGRDI